MASKAIGIRARIERACRRSLERMAEIAAREAVAEERARHASRTRANAGRAAGDARLPTVLMHRILSADLTPRESQILARAVEGVAREDLARAFACSEDTMKSHAHGLMKKLGARRLNDAVIAIYRDALSLSD